MEGSQRKSLSVPHLLLLFLPLLLSPLPSRSQALDLPRCFVCHSEISPNCEDDLSPSSTEFLQECPKGNDTVGPIGCQAFIIYTRDYEHPKELLFWRDCLYARDLDQYEKVLYPPGDIPLAPRNKTWYSGRYWLRSYGFNPAPIHRLNELRRLYALTPMPLLNKTYFKGPPVADILQFYLHPKIDNWNVSNGMEAKTLFPAEIFRKTPMRPVKCFVCTHDDPGCEGNLTSSNDAFIQECKGSVETTVPIGCQIHVAQYEYPRSTYFYRDCLYENYIKCHNTGFQWSDEDGHYIDYLPPRIGCMRGVKTYLGIVDKPKLPEVAKPTKPATLLYFLAGEPEPGRGHEHMRKFLDQSELSNGVVIEGLTKKQPIPPDFKVKGPFSCHTCDTSTQKCGGDKSETIGHLPHHICKSPHDDAYGCMMIWKEETNYDTQPYITTTKWMRRGCWYKGDLFCLQGMDPPDWKSGVAGRTTQEDCPTCGPRALIKEGKTVYWEDIVKGYEWDKKAHEKLRNCLKWIRKDLGVTDPLPELPEAHLGFNIHYSFCAGRTLCNDKKMENVKTFYNGTCNAFDELGYPCRCEGDNCNGKEDPTGWPTYVIWLVGLIALLIGIGIGVWVFSVIKKRRGQRAESKLPVDNAQSVPPVDNPQLESSGSMDGMFGSRGSAELGSSGSSAEGKLGSTGSLDSDEHGDHGEMDGIPI